MAKYATRMETVRLPSGEAQAVRLVAPGRSAAVVPAAGGELSSFVVEWQGQPVETIFRALDYSDAGLPPSQWTGRAPLLWPQPGRCRVSGAKVNVTPQGEIGSWMVEGRRLEMPGHGFARNQPWPLLDSGADRTKAWATVAIADNEVSRAYFPFAFGLECRCALDAKSLRLHYRVSNRERTRAFWFGIGNHISFRLPFTAAGRYDECVVFSPTNRQVEVGPDAFLTGGIIDKDLSRGRKLADATLRDTMFGGYRADNAVVELRDPASFGMRIQQRLPGHPKPLDDALRFVFWAEPDCRYFCPEPWIGEPNTLNTRHAAVELPAGQEFVWELEFTPLLDPWALSFRP